jgi:hypothetical protein
MKKPLEMVTGPAAFENFKRLMAGLLAVPKEKVLKATLAKRRKRTKVSRQGSLGE